MQIFHVGNSIKASTGGVKKVGVFRKQAFGYDPAGVVFLFEVWVGKTQKYLLKTALVEEVGHEFHRVAPHNGTILVLSRMIPPTRQDSETDVFGDFGSYFEAQYCLVW